jgi:3',5'-cyclic AMP phosphodiesterase CpdA
MRIAILADIHGNLPALEAALAKVETLKVDRLVIAGDIVVGSPDSLACWERVKALGCPVLRGNHERYVFDLDSEHARPEWKTQQFAPVQFAARKLGEAARRELAALPILLRLPEFEDVLFVHGSARSDTDLIFPYTRDADIAPMFAGSPERWIIRGHNHYAGVKLWGDRRIVTVGSVGLPLDGTPAAQFSILERQIGGDWQLEQFAEPYDLSAVVRRFEESGYLVEGGPIARLFLREVLTASFHILPFLKFQNELIQRGESLPLAEAVERYLVKITFNTNS